MPHRTAPPVHGELGAGRSSRELLDAVGVADVEELFEQIPADHRAARPARPAAGARAPRRRCAATCSDTARPQRRLRGRRSSSSAAALAAPRAGGLRRDRRSAPSSSPPVWGTPRVRPRPQPGLVRVRAASSASCSSMDFVGLPVYSWGCAAGHAIRMAARLTGRAEVLVPAGARPRAPGGHPHLLRAAEMAGAHRRRRGRVGSGDRAARPRRPRGASSPTRTAAVYFETPGYLGVIETAGRARSPRWPARTAPRRSSASTRSRSACSRRRGSYGADIVVGSTQPLGVHMNCGGGVGGFIATRDEERYAREYPTLPGQHRPDRRARASTASAMTLFEQTSYGSRENGNDWTGNSVYLWAVANAVYMSLLMGPQGFARARRADPRSAATTPRARLDAIAGRRGPLPDGFFKEFVVDFDATGRTVAEVNAALRERGIFGGKDLSRRLPRARAARALLRDRGPHARTTSTASSTALAEVTAMTALPQLPRRALGRAARAWRWAARAAAGRSSPRPSRPSRPPATPLRWCPTAMRRAAPPALPELSEPEVQRHYLHLSQKTLGMMGVSLFGTCTMKYNPRVNEHVAARPWIAELHPRPGRGHAAGRARDRPRLRPDPARAVRHGPVRVPARRRRRRRLHPRLRHPRLPRRRAASSAQRDEIITTIQAHPCNAGDGRGGRLQGRHAAARGGRLPVARRAEGRGLGPHRGADDQQPRRHGHLQPAHQGVGATSSTRPAASCFYDHANFNGVMGTHPRARARLRRLHVHAAQDVRRAQGRRRAGGRRLRLHARSWRRSCPRPLVARDGERYTLDRDAAAIDRPGPRVLGQRAAGRQGLRLGARDGRRRASREAADLSVLANNYMEKRLLQIRGVTRVASATSTRRGWR